MGIKIEATGNSEAAFVMEYTTNANPSYEMWTMEEEPPVALTWPSEWSQALEDVAGMGEADAMFLVCGHSGSGKWVFCRCLVNRLLNFENCAVGFMDLDPGQTEIAPPVGLKLDRGLNV